MKTFRNFSSFSLSESWKCSIVESTSNIIKKYQPQWKHNSAFFLFTPLLTSPTITKTPSHIWKHKNYLIETKDKECWRVKSSHHTSLIVITHVSQYIMWVDIITTYLHPVRHFSFYFLFVQMKRISWTWGKILCIK